MNQPANMGDAFKDAQILFQTGETGKAVASLHQFWTGRISQPGILDTVINQLANRRLLELFIQAAESWLAEHPDEALLRGKLLGVYLGTDQREQTLPHFAHLIDHEAKNDFKVYDLYCLALHDLQRWDEEADIARRAQAQFPESAHFYKLEGFARTALGGHQEARDVYDRAMKHAKDKRAELSMSRGILDLLMSDCQEGLTDFQRGHERENMDHIPFMAQRWKGESLAGKRLLIWQEQGIGDILMWSTLLPPLLADARQVALAVEARLHPLLQRSFPELELLDYNPKDLPSQQHRFDRVATMSDLMGLVLPDYQPAQHPAILQHNAELTGGLRASYDSIAAKQNRTKIVGIAWRTNDKATQIYRSIPLEQWQPLWELEGIQFVSVQYGEHTEEIVSINAHYPGLIHADPSIDPVADPDGAAAQIAAMDHVITIQNATAHFAGALGVPTTLMLPVASSWRFGLQRTDNQWYGSLTIERQTTFMQWDDIIKRVANHLASLKGI